LERIMLSAIRIEIKAVFIANYSRANEIKNFECVKMGNVR